MFRIPRGAARTAFARAPALRFEPKAAPGRCPPVPRASSCSCRHSKSEPTNFSLKQRGTGETVHSSRAPAQRPQTGRSLWEPAALFSHRGRRPPLPSSTPWGPSGETAPVPRGTARPEPERAGSPALHSGFGPGTPNTRAASRGARLPLPFFPLRLHVTSGPFSGQGSRSHRWGVPSPRGPTSEWEQTGSPCP